MRGGLFWGQGSPGAWKPVRSRASGRLGGVAGKGLDCGQLSSRPRKNTRREKFKFGGSAWFRNGKVGSATAFSKTDFHSLFKRVRPPGRAWHLQKGWGTMEQAEERNPELQEPPQKCQPLLACLDFGLRTVFSRIVSGTRPTLCGWLSDSWAYMRPLFSGRADKEQGTYWSLCADAFPLHTLFQVGDFSEKEVRSSWAEVCTVMATGSCTLQVPN